jgi:hypothetical protein
MSACRSGFPADGLQEALDCLFEARDGGIQLSGHEPFPGPIQLERVRVAEDMPECPEIVQDTEQLLVDHTRGRTEGMSSFIRLSALACEVIGSTWFSNATAMERKMLSQAL